MVLASLTKWSPRSLWNCALWSLLSPVACCLGTAAHASTKGMPSCFNYPEWHWNIGDSSIKTSIYREIPILYHGFALTFPYSFAGKVHVEQESQLKHTGWLHAGAHRRKSSFIIASVLHHCFFQMSYDKIYYPCEPVKNMVRILWLVALSCFTYCIEDTGSIWQQLQIDTSMESTVESPSLLLKAAEAPLESKPWIREIRRQAGVSNKNNNYCIAASLAKMFAESLALQRCQRWSLLLALWTLVAGNFTSWPATAMRYRQTWPQLTSSRGLGFDESHHTLGACQVLREPRMPLLWAGNLGFTMFQDGRRKKHWGILRPSTRNAMWPGKCLECMMQPCHVAWRALSHALAPTGKCFKLL